MLMNSAINFKLKTYQSSERSAFISINKIQITKLNQILQDRNQQWMRC